MVRLTVHILRSVEKRTVCDANWGSLSISTASRAVFTAVGMEEDIRSAWAMSPW